MITLLSMHIHCQLDFYACESMTSCQCSVAWRITTPCKACLMSRLLLHVFRQSNNILFPQITWIHVLLFLQSEVIHTVWNSRVYSTRSDSRQGAWEGRRLVVVRGCTL